MAGPDFACFCYQKKSRAYFGKLYLRMGKNESKIVNFRCAELLRFRFFSATCLDVRSEGQLNKGCLLVLIWLKSCQSSPSSTLWSQQWNMMKAVMVGEILMFSNLKQKHSPDADLDPNAPWVRIKLSCSYNTPCHMTRLGQPGYWCPQGFGGRFKLCPGRGKRWIRA